MKRVFELFLTVSLVLFLTACGGSRQDVQESSDSVVVDDTTIIEIDSTAMVETDTMMSSMDSTVVDSVAMEVATDSVK